MRQLYTLLILLFITNFVSAQFPVDLEIDNQTKKEAATLLEAYDSALGLTPKQYLFTKSTLEESLAKRKLVISGYEGKEQLDRLYKVLRQQNREMGNILTQIQYRRYEELQKELQPIKEVEM